MKVQFTTNKITQKDLQRHLKAKFNVFIVVISFQQLRNGAWQVTFKIDGDKQKRSTFCSEQKILRDRYLWMRDEAQDVSFGRLGDSIVNPYVVNTRSVLSSNIHSVDSRTLHCTCADFGRLKLNGKPICKHTIAYGKKRMNLKSIDQFIEAIA